MLEAYGFADLSLDVLVTLSSYCDRHGDMAVLVAGHKIVNLDHNFLALYMFCLNSH